jgi:hypothetical protein
MTAVLHEEVLRGVHMISVGHVPPGETVVVQGCWSLPLSLAGAEGATALLRIPTTVGAVYGRSPLPDSDDLRHGGPLQEADLAVRCDSGTVELVGHPLVDGRARLRLDAPIDLRVAGWRPGTLWGRAADGRPVRLEIGVPQGGASPALDAAILVDRSGSMAEAASSHAAARGRGGWPALSKHAVLVRGLRAAAGSLRPEDRLDLWQFDDDVQPIEAAGFVEAVERLDHPRGGTDIGQALGELLRARETRDVLLVTDGRSHALEVQRLARSGRRFHLVLIGENSLEAQLGHLAALTGGQVFVVSGTEAGEAVRLALRAMRQPREPAPAIRGAPASLETLQGGLRLRARWSKADPAGEAADAELSRAVAAVAAALALPRLGAEAAARLAEAEGLVCHLTSLVLVDEAGAVQEGLPAQRKIASMTPATAALCTAAEAPMLSVPAFRASRRQAPDALCHRGPPPDGGDDDDILLSPTPRPARGENTGSQEVRDLRMVRRVLDWSADPEALRRGDLTALPPVLQEAVRRAGERLEIASLARALGIPAEVVVLALIAGLEEEADRGARRFARAVLGKADPMAVAAARAAIGLCGKPAED